MKKKWEVLYQHFWKLTRESRRELERWNRT